MALANLQAAMAQLCTDPAARALFVGNPEAFREQASLTPAELASLHETAESSLHLFARSLLHKRAREAAHAMPLTRAALGESYPGIFEAFAATSPVARDPSLDARHFLEWLPSHLAVSAAVRQCARYELAWLRMRRGNRRWQFGLYALPTAPKRFLALWWRPRRAQPCRYCQWPRA